MANITNYSYKQYKWQKIHSRVERQCKKIRERFLSDMEKRQAILREDIVREYLSDNSLLSTVCVPNEELVALFQWYEMENDVDDIYRGLIFDTICNLWNYLSEYDVRFFKDQSIEKQLDYVAKKKTEFLSWYSKQRQLTPSESQVLMTSIHMPTYHRVSGHSLLDLMISYLLC